MQIKQSNKTSSSISKDRAKFIWAALKEQIGSKNIKKSN